MAGEYDKQFEELTGLVSRVAGRVDEIRLEIRDINHKLDQHSTKLDEHSSRFDSIDQNFSLMGVKLDQVMEKMISHEKRLRLIEEDRTTNPGVN